MSLKRNYTNRHLPYGHKIVETVELDKDAARRLRREFQSNIHAKELVGSLVERLLSEVREAEQTGWDGVAKVLGHDDMEAFQEANPSKTLSVNWLRGVIEIIDTDPPEVEESAPDALSVK